MIREKSNFIVVGCTAIFLGLAFSSSSFADGHEKGMVLYQSSCLQCHGEKGDGNGPEAVNYDPRPTNFTSSQINALTDPMIEKAVVVGIPSVSMHAWGNRLSNADIEALIRYIRTFTGN